MKPVWLVVFDLYGCTPESAWSTADLAWAEASRLNELYKEALPYAEVEPYGVVEFELDTGERGLTL